jgi:molybdate transport repressor ModE-like protein
VALEIDDLRLLVAIVQQGSLAEAARTLDASAPSVTRRLATMERRLGVKLMERTTRRFKLTDEGAFLSERATVLLKAFDQLESDTTAQSTAMSGSLRIGATSELGRKVVAPALAEFGSLNPRLDCQLTLSDSSVELAEHDLDVVIRVGMPSDPDVVIRKLISTRRVVCASPEYLAKNAAPQVPTDLLNHNCIRLIRGRRMYDEWAFKSDIESAETQIVRVRGTLAADSGEVLHNWLTAGSGIGLKTGWDVSNDLRLGTLVECLSSYWCNEATLYACFFGRMHIPFRVRAFIDTLLERLRSLETV